MKKSLLALAVLSGFAGVAAAQSTVTLFGIIDLNARNVKNGSNDALKTMSQDGINSSRFGVRGVEDLGGGMSASFWLEGGVNGDTGTPAGQTWTRRSTISLLGGFGELRLGRDYTPSFWNTTIFDPFGTNGVGSFLNLGLNTLGTNATTFVRANNSIGYLLPGNLGGLYGQLQISANESAAVTGNKQTSGRIGYAAGPINVAASFGNTKATPSDFKHNNIAGSYNFGVATLMLQYDQEKAGSLKATNYLVGGVIPMGQGEIHASYVKANQSGSTAIDDNDANQIALGYVYNLSKRTAMYGAYSRISNSGATGGTNPGANFVIGGGVGAATGAKSTGYEVGLRHSF
jgi:predicted porin